MNARWIGGCLAVTIALMVAPSAQNGAEVDKQFQAAIHKEMVDGDLKSAIKEYRSISTRAGVARNVAAQALVRMAECYRKLGDTQAREIYSRVVHEFPDQPVATEARMRLAEFGGVPSTRGLTAPNHDPRTVWSGSKVGIFGGGAVSRDGHLLTYTDWSTGDLALHDFRTGGDRRLTDTASLANVLRQRYAGQSRISPDGLRVAYAWFNGERYDLRLLKLSSRSEISLPEVIFENAEVSYVQPFDWSPDGTLLAVQLRTADHTGQIGLLSAPAGTLTVLKSFTWRDQSINMFFSPDGDRVGYDLPNENAPGERDLHVLAVDGSREVRVATHIRNDEMVGWSTDGKRLLFASDRTGSMQLWAQSLNGLDAQGPPRVIPSEFGGSTRMSLGLTNSGTLYYLATTYEGSPFRTSAFDFASSRATGTLDDPGEEFYSVNAVAWADWLRDEKLALTRRDRGGPVGMVVSVLNLHDSRVRQFRPQLNSFGPSTWSSDGQSFITSGSDPKGREGLFRVDANSGDATMLVRSLEGETFDAPALSPDGGTLYYRHATTSAIRIVARTLSSGVERELIQHSRRPGAPNVAAALALSPDGRHIAMSMDPRGNVRTLLAVSASSGEPRELLRASTGTLEPLMWAPDSQSLFVRHAGGGGSEVVRLSVLGSEPEKVDWNLGHDSRSFRVHPGGRQLVFVKTGGAPKQSEVRVLPGVAQ
jgi:Tol biopolymer transport system component